MFQRPTFITAKFLEDEPGKNVCVFPQVVILTTDSNKRLQAMPLFCPQYVLQADPNAPAQTATTKEEINESWYKIFDNDDSLRVTLDNTAKIKTFEYITETGRDNSSDQIKSMLATKSYSLKKGTVTADVRTKTNPTEAKSRHAFSLQVTNNSHSGVLLVEREHRRPIAQQRWLGVVHDHTRPNKNTSVQIAGIIEDSNGRSILLEQQDYSADTYVTTSFSTNMGNTEEPMEEPIKLDGGAAAATAATHLPPPGSKKRPIKRPTSDEQGLGLTTSLPPHPPATKKSKIIRVK